MRSQRHSSKHEQKGEILNLFQTQILHVKLFQITLEHTRESKKKEVPMRPLKESFKGKNKLGYAGFFCPTCLLLG